MDYIRRLLEGPRLRAFAKENSLSQPDTRLRHERSPGLCGEAEALKARGTWAPLVVLDEAQEAPGLLDEVQDLVARRKARFRPSRQARRGRS